MDFLLHGTRSGRPAFQSSIKSVNRFVIDAQGVVEASQSTYIAQFFTLYRSKGVPGPSLAFYEEFIFRSQITFFSKN